MLITYHYILFKILFFNNVSISRLGQVKRQNNKHNSTQLISKFPPLHINPLNTKRRLLYLKTQFVPRSKHFSSRL